MERQHEHPSPTGGRTLALLQGTFYLITGVWPILHIRSFEHVTGPKSERWLVKTVGALVGVLGGVLLRAGLRESGPSADLAATAAGHAAALAAVDVIYVSRGRIAPVYLLDAAVELGLVLAWATCFKKRSA